MLLSHSLIRRPLTMTLIAALAAILSACAGGGPNASAATDGPIPPGAVARLGRGAINVMAADPAGELLVVGTRVGLTVYDAHTFDLRWQDAAAHPVTAVALSPDGAYLAAGLESGLVLIMTAPDGLLITSADGPAEVSALGWGVLPDGSLGLTMGFADGALLFTSGHVEAGALVMDLNPAPPVRDVSGVSAIAYNPDGSTVAAGNRSGIINLWNTADQSLIGSLEGHRSGSQIAALAWMPDGESLVSGASDDTAIIWDVTAQTVSQTLSGHGDKVLSVAASADRVLTVDAAGQVLTWGLGGARIGLAGPLIEQAEAALAAPAADSAFLFSHDDGTLGRWQIGSRGNASSGITVNGHWPAADRSQAVAWSPDGKWIASGAGSRVLLWDAETHALQRTLDAHTMRVDALVFSPDSAQLASSSADRLIILWTVSSGAQISTLTGHRDDIASLAWSPDGSRLASAGSLDDSAIVWDVAAAVPLARLPINVGGVFSVAWSSDGSTLAVGDLKGDVHLWDVSGAEIPADPFQTIDFSPNWIASLAWSPDGSKLAAGAADAQVLVYDRDRDQLLHFVGHEHVVRGVAFHPDGVRLASAAQDSQVIVWDTTAQTSAEARTSLTGHTDGVNAVAWSPDGSTLASASDDGTIILWDVGPGE